MKKCLIFNMKKVLHEEFKESKEISSHPENFFNFLFFLVLDFQYEEVLDFQHGEVEHEEFKESKEISSHPEISLISYFS